jgi:glycosyltransferase involved in cell wall biosynthesis
MRDVTVEPMPGPDRFALCRNGRYLSAGLDGSLAFRAPHRRAWEIFDGLSPGTLAYRSWRPDRPMGGTQVMLDGLQQRLGAELAPINLQIHRPDLSVRDGRRRVVWIHNDAHRFFTWCEDRTLVDAVDAFVFVSEWQRTNFLKVRGLPPDKCHVIRNATEVNGPPAQWANPTPWRPRCAYISTPERGLSVLLDAWELLDEPRAELHVWSSFRLWRGQNKDAGYHALLARAARLPGVIYHGIRPNAEVRGALHEMHILAYPCIVPETSCLAAIEAMAAGCRVIVPSLGGLPETVQGFARTYPAMADRAAHARRFAGLLAEELRRPWCGDVSLAWTQVEHTRAVFGWDICVAAWRAFIRKLVGGTGVAGGSSPPPL